VHSSLHIQSAAPKLEVEYRLRTSQRQSRQRTAAVSMIGETDPSTQRSELAMTSNEPYTKVISAPRRAERAVYCLTEGPSTRLTFLS
jgi:hypothetical protein